METYEICNVSINELVTGDFSVNWSEDNQISLITPRGVLLFELQPNPLCVNPTMKFKRSLMYPAKYLPSERYATITDSLINNFERDDLYLAIMEEALTPKLPDKLDINPKIVELSWSPINLLKPSKCLCATLTSAGSIDLTLKLRNNWHSICNLSELWLDNIKDELIKFNMNDIKINSIDAETFRNNIRRLQGTAITWSKLYYDNCSTSYAYFVTAYRSCDLVIWKILTVPEFPVNVKPILIQRTRFDIDTKITKLLWIQLDIENYLILIGFIDGRIYCIDKNLSTCCLTDIDDIPITNINELSRINNEINIIITKSFFLIVMTINYDGKLLRQEHIQLPGFSITGIVLIDNSSVIVSTQDAQMFLIKYDKHDKLTYKSIKYNVKASKVQFLGMACAPSGITFINTTSPNGLYDHLINREPSTLHIFGFKGEIWDPWNRLNRNKSDMCNIYWDCLEIIRIRASREVDSQNHLPIIPESLNIFNIHQLRNVMWLTLISEILKQKKLMKKIDNVIGEISEAQPLIFVHSAATHIIKLSKKLQLTDNMRLCIHFLRLYLEVFLAGEDDEYNNDDNIAVKQAKIALNVTKNLDLIQVETCNLCGKIVTELPWNNSTCCPDGHRLPRCALTLLQITCLKYRSCPVCSRIFHPSLDEEYEDVKCLYCDVSAVYDTRIIGISEELEEKSCNLSIRPIWETQDSETSVVNERRHKKRRTGVNDTFTLADNKDDDIITELWQ